MDKNEIKNILPHREPMLLLDEASLVDGVSCCKYTVRGDEYFLQGHFPDKPVVPGVILCEMMAQSACLLVKAGGGQYTPYYTGLDKVKFRKKVLPGDCIEFKTEIIKQKGVFYFVRSSGYVDNALAVSGELSFALVKED